MRKKMEEQERERRETERGRRYQYKEGKHGGSRYSERRREGQL